MVARAGSHRASGRGHLLDEFTAGKVMLHANSSGLFGSDLERMRKRMSSEAEPTSSS